MLQENYPDLKSNTRISSAARPVEGTENRIAISRRDYNLRDSEIQHGRGTVPEESSGRIFGFKRDDAYFKTTEEEKKVPTVKF